MMTPYDEPRLSPWALEGRRLALALDNLAFVVVAGSDPGAAAEVALGMGRVQARRRRVVVADAVGLLSPIDDLVPFEASGGIVDVLVRGVPLRKVAHAVDGAVNLSVLPSGPGLVDRGRLLRSERWTSLTEAFRKAGALLVVVAPNREPALAELLRLVDGVVLVGTARPVAGVRVLAYVPGPESSSSKAKGSRELPSLRRLKRPGAIARVSTVRDAAPPEQRSGWWLVALFAALLTAGGGWWWSHRAADADALAGPASSASPTAANAAAWAVQIGSSATDSGVSALLAQEAIRDLPAVTFASVDHVAGNRSFRLLAGAYSERRAADTLLAALRARSVIPAVGGAVVRLPYAVLLRTGLTRDDASHTVTLLRSMGLPAYELIQEDGTVRLYAGAFEHTGDAAALVAAARAEGATPSVTYRMGRSP